MTDRPVAVLAHGLGGSTDLPIPYTYALIGAAWALTFTFAVVAFAWRRPRFDPAKPGRPLPQWVTTVVDAPLTRWALAAAGLLFAAWVAVAALFGPQDATNPLARRVLRAAVGRAGGGVAGRRAGVARDLTGAHRVPAAADGAAPSVAAIPSAWATGPRSFGLFAFVWLELASPDPGIAWRDQALAAGLPRRHPGRRDRAAVIAWCARADPFEVYSVVASRFSPLRRNRRAAASRSATRSTTCRRCRCGRAPWPCWRCCSDPPRSTASRRCRSGATSSTGHTASAVGGDAAAHRRAAGVRRAWWR